MKQPLEDKQILLGVTGSIAAYKAVELASRLTQSGARVDVILTHAATQFASPLTFQSVTGRRAYCNSDLWGREGHVQHIGLGKAGDLLAIAPASANTLAKLANGLADNLLTVTALAARCPLLLAPAMDGGMFEHPATQSNLETLRKRGATIIGPAEGHLASGLIGIGRMVEPTELLGQIRLLLSQNGPLAGKKIVVTAGGTQEPIDPVRVISNRSSGRQGFAIAQAALDVGAEVVLISGPSSLDTPPGARRIEAQTAEQMLAAVLSEVIQAEGLIMAAAVADFRPAAPASEKIKKEAGPPEIRLEPTPDILKAVAASKRQLNWPRYTIGFAAESRDLLANAHTKLQAKALDMIVANDINAQDAGFNVDTNRVILLYASDQRPQEELPLLSKDQVAQEVIQRLLEISGNEPGAAT